MSESARPDARQHDDVAEVADATSAASFAELGLPAQILRALDERDVTVPFPIQAATLPNALAGRDVLGRGRTGSGKTLAFGLGMLARTAGRRAQPKEPLALVLVPTRELAQQVGEALTPTPRHCGCGSRPWWAGCPSAGRPPRCGTAPRSS